MEDHTNSYWDYQEAQNLSDDQQMQQHPQYQYTSTDLQPSQTLSPGYYSIAAAQAFIRPAGTYTTTSYTDISMIDGNTYSDSYGRPAGPYGPYKTSESTDTIGFSNFNTPNQTTDGSFNSYEMVDSPHNRRYSDNSNRTSGQGSDSPLFSIPGDQEPWFHGSEFAVDKDEVQEEEAISSMPHNQEGVLVDLYNSEPRTVPNPYQQANAVEEVIYQENMLEYRMSVSQQQSFPLQSWPAHYRMQNVSDDPWNPVKQRIPAYPTGYTGFAPSPGPMVEEGYVEHVSASITPSPVIQKSSTSQEESDSSEWASSATVKETEYSTGWEHIVVDKGCLCRVSEIPEEETRKKGGKRTGSLNPETKEKARRIRQMRACWNCWLQKVPCSEGETCVRCLGLTRKQFSPSAHQLCCRSGFKDYESTLFPEFMHAHLKKSKIEDLITEHTTRFSDKFILVEVSTGAVFKPMRLTTNFFEPKTSELTKQSSLTAAEPDQALQLVRQYSAPVGILGLSMSDVKRKCDKHVEEMIKNLEYAAQVTSGDLSSQLPKQILEIVCEYSEKKDIPLLRNALKLHAIHYFMSSLITFSKKSSREIFDNVWSSPTTPPYLSSRLLNRQIKYAMNKLHHEITVRVLEEIERSLRTRTKDSWGPSFCAILLLCLCIESLQSAADTMVVCNIKEKGDEASYTRDQSWSACQELDEYPFQQCKKLFHDIYKSHKDRNAGGRSEKAFNPFKTAANNMKTGLDSATDNMVKKIHMVVCNSWAEIMELSEKPPLVNMGDDVDANDIKANNTGRLAARFLKSFYFPDE